VSSSSGFGIGLYQTARLAENSGFSLRLASNEAGAVCFVLLGASSGDAPTALSA